MVFRGKCPRQVFERKLRTEHRPAKTVYGLGIPENKQLNMKTLFGSITMTTVKFPLAVLIACSLFFSTSALATSSKVYRYTDDEGKVIIANSVPPGAEVRGYDILNEHGQLLQKVLPPPKIDYEAIEQERQDELTRAAQEREDRALLKLYSTPSDAIRARDRQLEALKLKIGYAKSSVSSSEKKLATLLQRAADIERAGQEVHKNLTAEIEIIQNQISSGEKEIAQYETEQSEVEEEFEPIIERLEFINEQRKSGNKL